MTTVPTAGPVMRPAGRLRVGTSLVTVLRLIGAALLGTNAGIHAYLWDAGYRTVPTIGVLFLLDVIGASVLTLAVLGVPRRLVAPAAVLGALLEAGTVSGLYYSTKHVLFGFIESSRATLYWQSVYTEIAGAVVLATLAAVTYRRTRLRGRDGASPRW